MEESVFKKHKAEIELILIPKSTCAPAVKAMANFHRIVIKNNLDNMPIFTVFSFQNCHGSRGPLLINNFIVK